MFSGYYILIGSHIWKWFWRWNFKQNSCDFLIRVWWPSGNIFIGISTLKKKKNYQKNGKLFLTHISNQDYILDGCTFTCVSNMPPAKPKSLGKFGHLRTVLTGQQHICFSLMILCLMWKRQLVWPFQILSSPANMRFQDCNTSLLHLTKMQFWEISFLFSPLTPLTLTNIRRERCSAPG